MRMETLRVDGARWDNWEYRVARQAKKKSYPMWRSTFYIVNFMAKWTLIRLKMEKAFMS